MQKHILPHILTEVEQRTADEVAGGDFGVGHAVLSAVHLAQIIKLRVPKRKSLAVLVNDLPDVTNRFRGRIRRTLFAGRIRVKRNDVRIIVAAESAEFFQELPHIAAEVAGDVRGNDADRRIDLAAFLERDLRQLNELFRRVGQIRLVENLPVADAPFEVRNHRADIFAPVVEIRHDGFGSVNAHGFADFRALQ